MRGAAPHFFGGALIRRSPAHVTGTKRSSSNMVVLAGCTTMLGVFLDGIINPYFYILFLILNS